MLETNQLEHDSIVKLYKNSMVTHGYHDTQFATQLTMLEKTPSLKLQYESMQCVGKSKHPAERCTKTADRTKGECSTGNKVPGGYREKHKNLKFSKIHTQKTRERERQLCNDMRSCVQQEERN